MSDNKFYLVREGNAVEITFQIAYELAIEEQRRVREGELPEEYLAIDWKESVLCYCKKADESLELAAKFDNGEIEADNVIMDGDVYVALCER